MPGIPNPVPSWSSGLLYDIASSIPDWVKDVVTWTAGLSGGDEWRRLVVKVADTGAGAVSSDAAVMSWDLINISGGVIDPTWTTADYTTCEGLFDTFFNTYKTYMTSHYTVSEYRWYRRAFAPIPSPPPLPKDDVPFQESGPPQRVTAKAIVGAIVGAQANQVAMSVTEKTRWPGHWGRFYLPGYANTAMDQATGRFGATQQTAIANAVGTLYSGLFSAEFQPIVVTTQSNKAPARAHTTVSSIQIDDVPDVIRRRRARNTTRRNVVGTG